MFAFNDPIVPRSRRTARHRLFRIAGTGRTNAYNSGVFPYDPALLAAVQSKPRSIAEVLEVMDTMGRQLQDADGLKWFHWLYFQVTRRCRRG